MEITLGFPQLRLSFSTGICKGMASSFCANTGKYLNRRYALCNIYTLQFAFFPHSLQVQFQVLLSNLNFPFPIHDCTNHAFHSSCLFQVLTHSTPFLSICDSLIIPTFRKTLFVLMKTNQCLAQV